MSYSVSSGNKSKRNSYRSSKKTHTTNHSNNKPDYSKLPNYGISETEYISTAEIDNFKTTEFSEFTEQLESIIRLNSVLNVLMGISAFLTMFSLRFFVPSVLFLLCFTITSILKLYIVFSSKNNIQYEMDDYSKKKYNRIFQSLIKISKSNRIWQVVSFNKVYDKKNNAGADKTVRRKSVKFTTKVPYYLKSNIIIPNIKLSNETLYFLPDKLLIIRGNKIGALNYEDVNFISTSTSFIEEEIVPSDTEIIGHTWQFVNKNGSPDKRHKSNKQIPICRYGVIKMTSHSGLNIELQISNYALLKGFFLDKSSFVSEQVSEEMDFTSKKSIEDIIYTFLFIFFAITFIIFNVYLLSTIHVINTSFKQINKAPSTYNVDSKKSTYQSGNETNSNNNIEIDYENAEMFENDLIKGENLEGKTVKFIVDGYEPNSAFGYDLWAGEHLNFVSDTKPDFSIGDSVTVKIISIKNVMGSWIIKYDIV